MRELKAILIWSEKIPAQVCSILTIGAFTFLIKN